MNAYELADDVKNISNTIEALEWVQKASPLLRQQADRIAHLEMLIANRNEIIDKLNLTPQTKPLSNDEIREIGDDCELKNNGILNWIDFARAIQERHGIK